MDRPKEIKIGGIWSLCRRCWRFDPGDRPSFTDNREMIEKIIDKTPRRVPIPPTGPISDSSFTDSVYSPYSEETNYEYDSYQVVYGYVKPIYIDSSAGYSSGSSVRIKVFDPINMF